MKSAAFGFRGESRAAEAERVTLIFPNVPIWRLTDAHLQYILSSVWLCVVTDIWKALAYDDLHIVAHFRSFPLL